MVFPAGGKHLGKKTFLGLEVVVHCPVIIEVILGEVCEDSQIEGAVVDPPEVEGVRRDLGDDMGDSVIRHFPEDPLHLEGFRGGVRCGEGSFRRNGS